MDQQGLELYGKAQRMAATDEVFRKEMLADPVSALEKLSDKKFPVGTKIKVIEQDPAYEATIVIPRFVGNEIDISELDNVAGGAVLVVPSTLVMTIVFVG